MERFSVDTICFDYYGTLVDVGKPFVKIRQWFRKNLAARGQAESEEAFYYCFAKRRLKLTAEGKPFLRGAEVLVQSYLHACRTFAVRGDEEAFRALLKKLFTEPPAFREAHEVLSVLRKKWRVGLLTNADNDVLLSSVRRQGFAPDFICSSEDLQANKPQKIFFERAASRYALDSQRTLMVGDSLTEDILPAGDRGWHAVLAARGYPKRPRGICIIENLRELYGVLSWAGDDLPNAGADEKK